MKVLLQEYGRAVITGMIVSLLLFYLLFGLEAGEATGLLSIIGNFSSDMNTNSESSDALIRKISRQEPQEIIYTGTYLNTGQTYQLADYFIWKEESSMNQKPVVSSVYAPDGGRLDPEKVAEGVVFTQQGIYQVELYGLDEQGNRLEFLVRLPVVAARRQIE